MEKGKKLKLAIILSIIGVVISISFLISNYITDYPLELPACVLVANGLILLRNYLVYRKNLGDIKLFLHDKK